MEKMKELLSLTKKNGKGNVSFVAILFILVWQLHNSNLHSQKFFKLMNTTNERLTKIETIVEYVILKK